MEAHACFSGLRRRWNALSTRATAGGLGTLAETEAAIDSLPPGTHAFIGTRDGLIIE